MDYQIQFELLLSKTKEISANQRISYFVSGLQEEIKANMQMAQPCSLDIAICLTEKHEVLIEKLKRARNNNWEKRRIQNTNVWNSNRGNYEVKVQSTSTLMDKLVVASNNPPT